ncbi:MAG: hypothetical protein HT580_11200 [Dechloromonas sp.]|nr:MAG: hypothetical protein HT580_11200 [Dechloromonas sp.]
MQAQQQRNRQSRRREGDDDAGDDKACGTGSPPMPSAAPRRATTPKSRKTPLPIMLKARILRNGCGLTIRP